MLDEMTQNDVSKFVIFLDNVEDPYKLYCLHFIHDSFTLPKNATAGLCQQVQHDNWQCNEINKSLKIAAFMQISFNIPKITKQGYFFQAFLQVISSSIDFLFLRSGPLRSKHFSPLSTFFHGLTFPTFVLQGYFTFVSNFFVIF